MRIRRKLAHAIAWKRLLQTLIMFAVVFAMVPAAHAADWTKTATVAFDVLDSPAGSKMGSWLPGDYTAIRRTNVNGVTYIQLRNPDGKNQDPWADEKSMTTPPATTSDNTTTTSSNCVHSGYMSLGGSTTVGCHVFRFDGWRYDPQVSKDGYQINEAWDTVDKHSDIKLSTGETLHCSWWYIPVKDNGMNWDAECNVYG